MSNFLDSLQVELIFSLIIMVVMAIFFIYAGKKFATADPTARPKGVVLVVETGVKNDLRLFKKYHAKEI